MLGGTGLVPLSSALELQADAPRAHRPSGCSARRGVRLRPRCRDLCPGYAAAAPGAGLSRVAPASARGQSRGRRTGGPSPLAGRGARPGEWGVGEASGAARGASAETCQKPGGRQSALAPRGPARVGMENPKGGGGCAGQGTMPHTLLPCTPPPSPVQHPGCRVCDGSQGPFCAAFQENVDKPGAPPLEEGPRV